MTTRTRLYIAGPMTGIPNYNRSAFNFAADSLRAAGFTVTNPADTYLGAKAGWRDYMDAAIPQVFDADGLAILPGYHGSNGARVEVAIARQRGIPVQWVRRWLTDAEQQARMARLLDGGTK